MIKKKLFSLPIRSRSLPCSPGDVPIVSDQMQSVGISNRLVDRRAQELLQLLNYASCAYVQARQWRRNCQVVRGCSHPFFFRDKGQAVEKSWSAAKGWYVSKGLLRRVILCVILDFFPYHNIWKKCTTCGFFWPYTKGRTQCCVLDCSTCDSIPRDTKVEEDGQQTETMIVPATFTKHLMTMAANLTKRKKFWDVKKSWGGV